MRLTDVQWWKDLFKRPTPEEEARRNVLLSYALLLERNRKFEAFLVEKLHELEKRALPAPSSPAMEPEMDFPEWEEEADPFIIEMAAEDIAPEEPFMVAASLRQPSFSDTPAATAAPPAEAFEEPAPAPSKPTFTPKTFTGAGTSSVSVAQAAKPPTPPRPVKPKPPPAPQAAPALEAPPPRKRKAGGLKLIAAQRKSPAQTPDAPKSDVKKGLKLVPAAKVETEQGASPAQRKKGWRIAPAKENKDE